ncbi:MAG: 3-oxoacyl-[acyl-carrier-protein] synthase III C-terminal domain-containing protein [Eubacterium sp.]|nr:3-oxoacyl-[acyl-carrier-protein] synthase III C-terminal domain-containing protein [Eubacterium sp.]
MEAVFKDISIEGIAAVVPDRVEENSRWEDLIGTKRLKRQIRITGVERRHLPKEGQSAAATCMEAARLLFSELKWEPNSLDYLIFVTQFPSFLYPSTAFYIHKKLGLSKKCVVFDVNLGCSGFTAGIQILSSLMRNMGDRGMLLAGDAEYRTEDQKNREDYIEHVCEDMLFGVAGSAVALERKPHSPLYATQYADGNGYDVILRTGEYTKMNGSAVYDFSMDVVAPSITEFKKKYSLADEDVDYYVFHQAQGLIVNGIGEVCGIPVERNLTCLKDYGNTSSSSIPLALCVNRDRLIESKTVRLVMCGFGIGLSWATLYAEMDPRRIYPVKISEWTPEEEDWRYD